jgi:hypothetical protein
MSTNANNSRPYTDLSLAKLKEMMLALGVVKLYFKRMAENDNSKNQVYLGPDLSSLNVLPIASITADPLKPDRLKAPLKFEWLDNNGSTSEAPGAQLILYPQYPEVRFSGFLQRCDKGPSDLMTTRQSGRLLFLGVTSDTRIIGYVAAHNSRLSKEIAALSLGPTDGVFVHLSLIEGVDERTLLVEALTRIADSGWIDSKRLGSDGSILECKAPNCGGYTLEAELGIRPNGFSEPDFHGWEIKQHAVAHLDKPSSGGAITLMTPEPTGGIYAIEGVPAFIRRFGHADQKIKDRLNFGGIHNALGVCSSTGLSLALVGYDIQKMKITDPAGGLSLLTKAGEAAATWPYAGLMAHWNRKHARAAYVPSNVREAPMRQYRFGDRVRLAVGTDFLFFLKAVAKGAIYYDPGIKMEGISTTHPQIKRRSQFRIRSSQIPLLYRAVDEINLGTNTRVG